MTADRITALEEALTWYAEQARLCRLIHSEGDAGRNALAADGGERARAALAAIRAAPDCHQQDLVTATQVRIKPLVWVRHWAWCYTVKSLKTEDNACDVVYYAERAEKTGHTVNTVTKPGYFRCWVDFGEEFESLEAAKAAVQADYDASILSALDLTPAPAVEPRTVIGGDASVAVCPICDIAGCKHVREQQPNAAAFVSDVQTRLQSEIAALEVEHGPDVMQVAIDNLRKLRGEAPAVEPVALTAQDAARVPEIAALIEAARALRADMLERAQMGMDVMHGEQYRIVNAGRTAWADFDAALRAIGGDA